MQLIFRFGFLKLQNIPLSLADWHYILLVISTVCLTAGGAIINAIFQQDSDSINKPEFQVVGKFIPENRAYNLYAALTFIGVSIGFYLSNVIQRPNFSILFILIASTLYFYASSLKNSLIIGNSIIALINSIYLLMIGLFDLLPATFEGNRAIMGLHFSILIDYSIITFFLSLLIELISDIQNTKGDSIQGLRTLQVVIGISKAKMLAFIFSIIPILCVFYYLKFYLFDANLILGTIYGLVFIVSPLIYCSTKILSAKEPKEFRHLIIILKWILFFTFLSIFIISINIKQNA